jgi:hypothetical protein
MLAEMAAVGGESIVSWQPHGTAFRVHQPDVFSRMVMPRYFNQTKYKSFQRQLHIYGFHRIGNGMDKGAYVHPMFNRNKKSMSLRMSCIRNKGKQKKSSNAVHHRAGVDPALDSSETSVDNDENQDRRSLMTKVLQADPILQACTTTKEKKRGSSKRGPTTAFTTGCTDPHLDEEEPLVDSPLLLNQEVPGGLVDWMEQAQTILFRDEERSPPPYHGYDSSVPEKKGNEGLAILYGENHQKQFDEGFFEGRFFHVVETKVEDFSAVVNRGGPRYYMPRSA